MNGKACALTDLAGIKDIFLMNILPFLEYDQNAVGNLNATSRLFHNSIPQQIKDRASRARWLEKRQNNRKKVFSINGENSYVKCVFLGHVNTDKYSVIRDFRGDGNHAQMLDIAADYTIKNIVLKDMVVGLQLYDTTGQEKFRSPLLSFARNTQIVFLVCNAEDRATLDDIELWANLPIKKTNNAVVMLLVDNLSSAVAQVTVNEIEDCVSRLEIDSWYPNSREGRHELELALVKLFDSWLNNGTGIVADEVEAEAEIEVDKPGIDANDGSSCRLM